MADATHQKRCSRCKEVKGNDQFSRGRNGDGLHSWCKPCVTEYNRERALRRDKASYDVDPALIEKLCGKCRKIKPAGQFNRDRHNNDGLGAWCKVCWKEHRASCDYDIDPTIYEKCCSRCKLVKPVDQFSPYRTSKDGLCSWCKSCANEHSRERGRKLNYDVDQTIRDKYCSRCKETKPVGEFDRQRRSRDGLQTRCRTCMKEVNSDWYQRNKDKMAALSRAWAANNPEKAKAIGHKGHLRKTYGLTLDDYDKLLAMQDGKCAGCGDEFGDNVPHVDHNHETGAVRALLCGPCNKALGMALESPERLIALARYMQSQNGR